jgi:predicted PurR-regulated permease PerM
VAIYLAYASSWMSAIGLVVWSMIALAVIDNFIKPLAMRHGTGLPTLALFFGLAGGIEAYGPIGIFAGPAVISIFAALLRVYERTYTPNPAESPTVAPESPTLAEPVAQPPDLQPLAPPPAPTAEPPPQHRLKEDLQ